MHINIYRDIEILQYYFKDNQLYYNITIYIYYFIILLKVIHQRLSAKPTKFSKGIKKAPEMAGTCYQ